MQAFRDGFLKGAKEAPTIFFAPVIIAWKIFVGQTDKLISKHN